MPFIIAGINGLYQLFKPVCYFSPVSELTSKAHIEQIDCLITARNVTIGLFEPSERPPVNLFNLFSALHAGSRFSKRHTCNSLCQRQENNEFDCFHFTAYKPSQTCGQFPAGGYGHGQG